MADDFAQGLASLLARGRADMDDLIAQSEENVNAFERVKWYISAECSHAAHLQKLLDHRQEVISGLIGRLGYQLPAPHATPLVAESMPPNGDGHTNGHSNGGYEQAYQPPMTSPPYDEEALTAILQNMARHRAG